MADQREAGISWTDETWNPVVGCSIVSPACTNCYAMAMAARIERMAGGTGKQTHYAGTTRTVNGKPVWTGKLQLAPDHILTAPLRWKRPRRVFVNSMSDLFHEDMPEAWIDRVFAVMALSPQHTFQILTKRPDRMRAYLKEVRDTWTSSGPPVPGSERIHDAALKIASQDWLPETPGQWPLPNVWLGVTAEDQRRADERIPDLLATPAAVRFVSAEPLLGPIDFGKIDIAAWLRHLQGNKGEATIAPEASTVGIHPYDPDMRFPLLAPYRHMPSGYSSPGLDWIIAGGESGPGARPTHPDWIRSIRDQCAAADVAFHFKQWGEWAPGPDAVDWPYDKDYDRTTWMGEAECIRPIEKGWAEKYHSGVCGAQDPFKLKPYGGSLFGTPEYLDQVARCPQPKCGAAGKCLGNDRRQAMRWVGKRRAGRMLDGRIHDAFPEPGR